MVDLHELHLLDFGTIEENVKENQPHSHTICGPRFMNNSNISMISSAPNVRYRLISLPLFEVPFLEFEFLN